MAADGSEGHVPAWLANNPLYRKLFLVRKLFFAKRKRTHYSQFAEDISIREQFPRGHRGFFVDVGCFHPFKFNNTWMLYKRGWRGINIDIDQIKIDAFNWLRKHDTNVAAAISNKTGEVSYYERGFFSLMNSVAEDYEHRGECLRKVSCRTLTSVIEDTPYKDRQIDLLSVDAEGHDFEVLQSLDFPRYQPRVVAVEAHEPDLEKVQATDVYRFLTDAKYSLVGWCGLTLLMASQQHRQTFRKVA